MSRMPVVPTARALEGDSLIGYKIQYYEPDNKKRVTFEVKDCGSSTLSGHFYEVKDDKGACRRIPRDEMERIIELAKANGNDGITSTANCFPE
jgi:hypothetical protein